MVISKPYKYAPNFNWTKLNRLGGKVPQVFQFWPEKTLNETDLRSFVFLQLDCDEDSPNFDEDGRDEYNEIHMLV